MCDEKSALNNGVPVRARIVGYAGHAQEANRFTTAPIFAVQKLLSKIGWSKNDVDLWEVNEAFAVVPMAFMRDMEISANRLTFSKSLRVESLLKLCFDLEHSSIIE